MAAGVINLQANDGKVAGIVFEDGASGNVAVTVPKDGGKLAADSLVVHKTGDETIAGVKTFSDSVVMNGNVGIGTSSPVSSLTIKDGLTLISQFSGSTPRPTVTNGVQKYGVHTGTAAADDGFLRLSAGGGTNASTKSYIDISGYSNISDMNMNIVFGTVGSEKMRIGTSGNVMIGTTTDNGVDKLQVNGSISSGQIPQISTGDLNDYKTRTQVLGTYPSGYVSNIPIDDHGYLEVIVYSPGVYVMQRFTTLGAIAAPGRVFVRCLANGVWSAWVEK